VRRLRRNYPGEGALAQRYRGLLLSALGSGWKIKFIDPVSGYWKKADIMRIEGVLITPDGRNVGFGSWDTMTRSVRHGIAVDFSDPHMVEAYAIK
jgi:hypothetical protein